MCLKREQKLYAIDTVWFFSHQWYSATDIKNACRIVDEYRNKKRLAFEKASRSVCYLHQVGDFTSPRIPYFGAFAALNLAINCCVEASKLSLSASP